MVSFWNEAINFNNEIADTSNFKSFKYKAKLLGNNEADGANWILKYVSNFCRSLEMTLINFKVELKFKLTSHSVFSVTDADNDNLILITLFLLTRTQYCMYLQSNYEQKTTKTIKTS